MDEVRFLQGNLRENSRREAIQHMKAKKNKIYLGFNKGLLWLEPVFNLGDWKIGKR